MARGAALRPEDIVGATVDLTYGKPPSTYRVRVVRYNAKTGLHQVDSTGLSSWDGEPFRDTIDAGLMMSQGLRCSTLPVEPMKPT